MPGQAPGGGEKGYQPAMVEIHKYKSCKHRLIFANTNTNCTSTDWNSQIPGIRVIYTVANPLELKCPMVHPAGKSF